jgi:SAM-dependent methyltransferase
MHPSDVSPLGCVKYLEGSSVRTKFDRLYCDRKLSGGHPDLAQMALAKAMERYKAHTGHNTDLEGLLIYLGRLVDLNRLTKVVVIGCGPDPQSMQILLDKGFNAVGIEPVESYVQSARAYLERNELVLQGTAENIPLPDSSQHIVICESVMEHVDSPSRSLAEMYRILAPGGIAYISTTNRYRFQLFGHNGEFTTPYYNWFPRLVKECYVFHHLHYAPCVASAGRRASVTFTLSWICSTEMTLGCVRAACAG